MPDPLINIFISYSHQDSDFVNRLDVDLRQQGFGTWIDRHGLVGGLRWRRELQEAVERAQILLIVLSPDAVASQNVQIEYDYALDERKVVIPVYYRQCNVPMELRAIQWVDFRQSYEQGIAALVQVLHIQQEKAGQGTGQAQGPHPSTQPPPVPTGWGATPTSQGGGEQQVTPSPVGAQSIAPERPWNVPFRRNPFFTGRAQLLEQLHQQLSRAPGQSYALSGLGGIGKTQTAIEYAYRYRDEYSAVFWVRANSHDTLVTDFVALARLLSLPGQDAQDQMQIVATVKRWLEQHDGWLLILNNADEVTLLSDFLPGEYQGNVLLTTRSQATGRIAVSISVDKLDLSDGMQFLLRRAKLLGPDAPLDSASPDLRTSAQTLVEELDGLPLALEQAAAYIEETDTTLAEYLELYQRHRLALLKRQSSFDSEYPNTVASTWALSFQQVEQANPAAAELLRLCAFLDPDGIPEAILTQGADQLGPVLQEVATDPLLLNDAIQLLRRYSLVKRDPKTKQLNLHRLVQVVLRESLDSQAQQQWAERSVRAVNAIFPEVEFANWERCELCLPHAQVCAQLIEQYHLSFPEAARLLHLTGRYLRDRGHYAQAEPLLQRALSMREQVLGPEHAEIASTLNDLVELYEYRGKYAEAEPLMQRALSIREKVLGPEHPETADTLNVLAAIYVFRGKYAQAEPLLQRALALREKALGANHPDVAENVNNLAIMYVAMGKYAEAEPLYQRALALQQQALGPEHPDTLKMLGNLANLYTLQGKFSEGERLNQHVLEVRERVLGPEHPYTAITLFNLAQLYYAQGKYQQAEPLAQRALAIHEKVMGPEHARTMQVLLYLAQIYQAEGQLEQAESLYQRVLTGFERELGPEHPYVAETLTNLGRLCAQQGRYEQAEPLFRRALTIYEQALGNSHPSMAQTLHYLAQLYEKQGHDEQAGPLYRRALTIREQVLGPDHPATVTTREAFSAFEHRQQEQQGIKAQPDSTTALT